MYENLLPFSLKREQASPLIGILRGLVSNFGELKAAEADSQRRNTGIETSIAEYNGNSLCDATYQNSGSIQVFT